MNSTSDAMSAAVLDARAMARLLLQVAKLKAFSKFENTAEALQAAASLVDSKLSKGGLPTTAVPAACYYHTTHPLTHCSCSSQA